MTLFYFCVLQVSSLGTSTNGHDIPVVGLTSNLQEGNNHDKVNIALFGALHGDEPVGTEVLIRFIRHLVTGKKIDI